jgi:hypothetical protein
MTDGSNLPANIAGKIGIYEIRGKRAVLDRDVAIAFGVKTKRVNEARSRNPAKFSEEHAFKLTDEEGDALRSQFATSNEGRGGRRYAPWVYTVKGVARLAMILDTPQALAASDRIIDIFIEVQAQIARGAGEIVVQRPSLIAPTDEEREERLAIRKKLSKAVQALLDGVLHVEEQQALGRAGRQLARGLKEEVIERLRTRGLENEKLSADAELVLAEAQKALAVARKTHSEADSVDLDNLQKKIAIVERLQKMHRDMEPAVVIDLIGDLAPKPKRIS